MLEDKKIKESSKIIIALINEGKIIAPKQGTTTFFFDQSRKTLIVARRLLDLYSEEKLDTHLWVINASYYSMFFAATALLAYYGRKINVEVGIHMLTYHALVHYFVKEESKLKKEIMDEYKNAFEDAEELLQFSKEKIKGFVLDFEFELNKRKTFTYDLGVIAERKKAETSFERAKKLFTEIELIISKK